jgi:dipeptidyl-peptidase-3
MLSSGALAISLLAAGIGYAASPDSATSPIVERVGDTVYLQIEANSFNSLTPKQQALAYWLSQAAIAISPIIYDQQSRFGLRQKALLEAVVANNSNVDPAVYSKILDYTKLFWTHRGNHNLYTAQKFLPTFTPEELNRALTAVGRADLLKEEASLQQSLFDPGFEPSMTTKSPKNGLDILQASSNNFYLGVTLEDLKGFTEKYALNSRLVKQDGKLIEQVYRAGTPDGKVAPGLYAEYLKKANRPRLSAI